MQAKPHYFPAKVDFGLHFPILLCDVRMLWGAGEMPKKRKIKVKKRLPKRFAFSWRSILSLIGIFALGYVAMQEDEAAESGRNPDAIFTVFARLNVNVDSVMRMKPSPIPPRAKPIGDAWLTITEVLDGDTVKLSNGETVRLLGVDAPESSVNRKMKLDIYEMGIQIGEQEMLRLGKAATRFAKSLAKGKRCWLEYDRSETDIYDRALAYIHLEDGTILNEEMIAAGYAKAYIKQPFAYRKRYILHHVDARDNKRGLWGMNNDLAQVAIQ